MPTEDSTVRETRPSAGAPLWGSAGPRGADPRTLSAADMERAEKLRILGEMASGVIHDINNMLGAILGRAQLVRMKSDVDEIKRHVEHIEMIVLQAGETVKRLQDFTRQGHRTDMQTVNLNDVIGDAMQVTRYRWESQAQERGIFYTIDTHLSDNVTVSGVRSELVDAVANMIFNALDAMPGGGPLTLLTGRRDGLCQLEVIDEGVGMTAEQAQHVFSPFFTTKGEEGTGLGLAVVYGVVKRHGGDVQVESVLGHGSRFTVTLPHTPDTGVAPPPVREVSVDSARRRVLLVDDDATILDVIGEALREVGHEVHTCDAGAAAIVAMEDKDFDVVITDLGMPGVNGWDVARRARQLTPPLPVIVISGWGAQITKEQLEGAGVDMILPKPFRLEQIRKAIADIALRRPV
ncbi:MAG TPA: response regulator [bacterium]|nr:response regulator [bacterium]